MLSSVQKKYVSVITDAIAIGISCLCRIKWQSVVSVGDSADATAAIATEHGAKVVAGARGRSKQMNDGAAAASGDVVLFLHADTTVPSDAVTVARETFANDARVVAGGFVSLLERADKTFWFLSFHNVVKSFLYPALLKARPISH